MKRRKILYLFPLAALVLTGCSLQEVKSWIGKNVYWPARTAASNLIHPNQGQNNQQGGNQGGGEQQQEKQIKRITIESAPEQVAQNAVISPAMVSVRVFYEDQTEEVKQAEEVVCDTSKPGTNVELVAKYKGKEATTYITVIDEADVVHVESIKYSVPAYTVKAGETLQITIEVTPENATDQSCSFTSSNTEIATVTSGGLVTGVKGGAVTIHIVSNDNPEATKDLNLTVTEDAASLPGSTKLGYNKLAKGEELKNNEKINIAGAIGQAYYVMPAYASGNNIPAKSIELDGDKLDIAQADEFTVIKNDDGTYSFKQADNKYLAATGGSSGNQLKAINEINASSKFTYSVGDDGYAQLEADSSIERRFLCFNPNAQNNNPLFACYKQAQYEKYAIYHDGNGDPDKTLESISITSEPTKKSYYVGESLDPTGLAVSAHYTWENGSEDVALTADQYTISPTSFTNEHIGDATEVTVTFKTQTAKFTVSVSEPPAVLNKIEISGTAAKTAYIMGESYSREGLDAYAYYEGVETPVKVSDSAEWTITPETASLGDESFTVKAVFDNKEATKVVEVTVSDGFTSLADVYAAAEAGSTEKFKFKGTVVAMNTNSYVLQDGEFGINVYTTPAEGITLGNKAEVEATVKLRYGCPQTDSVTSQKDAGTGTAQTAGVVTNMATLDALKHNVLANAPQATFKSKNKAWANNATAQFVFTIGGDDITVNFDQKAFDETKAAIANAAVAGDKFVLTDLITAAYSTTNQLAFYGNSSIASFVVEPTNVTITSGASLLVGGELSLTATVAPEGASQLVDWSIQSGEDKATLSGSALTGVAAGSVVVRATAKNYASVYAEKTITVSEPEKVYVESIVATPSSINFRLGDEGVEITAAVSPANVEEDIVYSIKSGSEYVTLSGHTVSPKAVGAAVIRIEGEESHIGVDVNVSVKNTLTPLATVYSKASTDTSNLYTFQGTIVAMNSNSFVIQDGAYGMNIRVAAPEGAALGKLVEVDSKLATYHDCPQTTTDAVATLVGDGTAQVAQPVASKADLDALNHNVLADVASATFVSKNKEWKNNQTAQLTFTIGSDNLTVSFDQKAFDSTKAALMNAATAGQKFSLGGLITAAYSGTNQFNFTGTSTVELVVVTPTSVNITSANTVGVGGALDLTAEVGPAGAPQDVDWEIVSGNTYASITDSTLTGLAAGTAKIRATAKGHSDVYDEMDVTVSSEVQVQKFTKVTSNLADYSGTYLIVCEGSNTAFKSTSTATTNNNFSVTIEDGEIVASASVLAEAVTIAKGTTDTTKYSIKNANNKYIDRPTSGSGGGLSLLDTANELEIVYVSGETSYTEIRASSYTSSTKQTLQYNSGSPRFQFYTSSQSKIQLYKLGA